MTIERHLAAAAVIAACGLLPAVAQADALDYSYLDFNYLSVVPQDDPLLQDGTGLEVNGSYALPAGFYVTGDYSRTTFGVKGFISKVYAVQQDLRVGTGYHHALTERLDLDGGLAYGREREWVETPTVTGPTVTVHPVDIYLGLRGAAADKLELRGYLSYGHLNGYDSHSHGFKLGLLYKLFPDLGLGLSYGRASNYFGATSSTPASSESSYDIALFARLLF